MKHFAIIWLLIFGFVFSFSENFKHPDCVRKNSWAVNMALGYMKNNRIITPQEINHEKTTILRLSSEKKENGIFRQVHYIVFTTKSDLIIKVITVNDASFEECSMSDVAVFLIEKELDSNFMKQILSTK